MNQSWRKLEIGSLTGWMFAGLFILFVGLTGCFLEFNLIEENQTDGENDTDSTTESTQDSDTESIKATESETTADSESETTADSESETTADSDADTDTDTGPDWAACESTSQCVLVANNCCGWCGVPTLGDVDAVNKEMTREHFKEVCKDPAPICPDCPAGTNPDLVALCNKKGFCEAFDMGTKDL